MATITKLFLDRVAATPDTRAFSSFRDGAWHDFTWREFERMARAFGLGIESLGVRRGDTVAVLGSTRHEWVVSDIGALGVGAICVGLYPSLAPEGVGSLRYVIEHSEAKLLVVESAAILGAKILPIRDKLPRIEHIVVWDDAEEAKALDARVVAFADVLAKGEAAHAADGAAWERSCRVPTSDDVAILVYTSGTTGEPKGAMLTHGSIHAMVKGIEKAHPMDGEAVSTVSFLPLAHVAERCVGFYGRINVGAATHFARSLETLLDDIATAKPTRFGSVPRIFEKAYARVMGEVAKLEGPMQEMALQMIDAGVRAAKAKRRGEEPDAKTAMMATVFDERMGAPVRARFGGRCNWFVTGAAPTAPEILEFFDACGMPTYEVYGLTETSGVVTTNRPDAIKYGTVGKPLPGMEVRIADDGEILARGGTVFLGYFKDDAATAECLKDGWFHTGDIGKLDGEGFLTITDRKKSILITAGGKNITPSNIENEVKNDPLVSYCHLHADRRAYPVALVCLDPERLAALAAANGLSGTTAAELKDDPVVVAEVQKVVDRVNGAFARYEQIRKFAILSRELSIEGGELTPTLKVKRKEVDSRYAAVLDALYATG
jgi:long-chain acyl-CoA synthetase